MGHDSMPTANICRSFHGRFILLGFILFVGIFDAVSIVHGKEGKLVITGSSTMAPLLLEIGKRFEATHPNTRIDVQTGGSSRGIADTINGLADIGMASRALKAQEQDIHGNVVARDGIGIILHASNPIQELTNAQIQDIYTGKITNWQQVGGPDATITVVNKAQGRSTLELFLQYFQLSNRAIHAHVVIGDNEQGIKTVAGNPNAIGYVSIGTAQYDVSHGLPIRLLPLQQVPASIENVRAGIFPLSRPLTLVTKSTPTGLTKTFIEFARSSQVHDLILKQYFVPLQN